MIHRTFFYWESLVSWPSFFRAFSFFLCPHVCVGKTLFWVWANCVCVTDETMVINVFCGVVSGVLSSSLANPTDVLKVRCSFCYTHTHTHLYRLTPVQTHTCTDSHLYRLTSRNALTCEDVAGVETGLMMMTTRVSPVCSDQDAGPGQSVTGQHDVQLHQHLPE